jgi:hypothetical protein
MRAGGEIEDGGGMTHLPLPQAGGEI